MRIAALGLMLGMLAAAGCSGTPKNQPAWVAQRLNGIADTYPNLHDVPRGNNAQTDPNHWAQVRSDVEAAGQALHADPRSQHSPPDDPNAFINDAHNAIDETRQSHDPN